MKSMLVVVLMSCWAATDVVAQTHRDIKVPDHVEHDLFGRVKRLKETDRMQYQFGKYEVIVSHDERIYDVHGSRLTKEESDQHGTVTERVEYIYDDNGGLTGEVAEDFEEDTKEEFTITIDVPARIIIKENIATGEKKAILYNAAGYEHKVKDLDADGKVIKSAQFKRWSKKNEYKYQARDAKGVLITTFEKWMNADGTLKKVKLTNHETKAVSVWVYRCQKKDEKGNWLVREEALTRVEKGKEILLSKTTSRRGIEYHE